jgi:hypothetical protein
MRQYTRSTCVLICVAAQGNALAGDAFMPPEVAPSRKYDNGLQVEFSGNWLNRDRDSANKSREDMRQLCEAMGKPYVNTVPIEEEGQTRETVIQLEGLSYMWSETKYAAPEEGRDHCRMTLKTHRRLHVSRFDGRRTATTVYNYETRKYGSFVREGDATYFGPSRPEVQQAINKVRSESLGERVIAGVRCHDYRLWDGSSEPAKHTTQCVTSHRAVAGRNGPIHLSFRLSSSRQQTAFIEATSITPNVRVDLGVFDGPPGFQKSTASKSRRNPLLEEEDDANSAPVDAGRRR